MKKIFTLVVFSILSFTSYSQNPFTLTKSVSFGLNNHTNRDYPNFSFVDKEKNSILIGTTERDSTFSDVLVTKLDENYNLIWQKTTSFSTSLSYEIPLKAFTNTNGDIYVFGASKTNATKIYGKIFYIKYDKNGNELFKKIIENKDGSEYHDFGYFDVKLNSDDTVNLVYSPHTYSGYGSNDFYFLKIDVNGNATQLFTREIINQGIRGKIENDTFYFISRKLKNPDNTNEGYSHTFLKIDIDGNENSLSIENTDFHKYYLNNNYENFYLDIDGDKNSYLTTLNSSDNDTKGRINISLINSDNILKFVLTTSTDKNYYLIGSFINSTNQLVIIANDLDTEKLVFLSVDNNNQIITLKENNSYLGTGFKLNNDGTFFITTSNSNIRLFSDELNEISSFNNSNTYNLVDFSKVDNNTIISLGVEVNKMFPQSDFNTQLNIISEKINTTNILNKYTFSGEGTSNVFQHKTYVDNDNNYILFVTEKLGPICYYIGCSQPPLSVRVVKYNSDLKKLWEYDFIGQVSNIESYYGDNNLIIDSNNNIYLNLLNKERDKSHLYKLSSEGILLYKKESVKSRKIVINETNSNLYIISDNIQYIDQNTWKTYLWTEVFQFDLNGNLINKEKYDNRQYIDYYIENNSLYLYFRHLNTSDDYSDDPIVYLYKDNVLLFKRIISYPGGSNNQFIDKTGTLIFSTYSVKNFQGKIHKLSLNNNYSSYNISEELYSFFQKEDKYIGYDSNNYLTVYNKDFNVIKKSTETFSNCCSGFNISLINNKIFIQWSNPGEVNSAFINDDLEIENQFNFNMLDKETFLIDKENNLITVSTFGNGLYLKPWESWRRGLLSKYSFNTTLSIENFTQNSNKQIKIYPNPTKNIFTINLSNNRFNKVEVFSINGQLINTYQKKEIDITNFKTGLYILKVFTKENTVLFSKIIKQ